jgi:hypothetical protein
MKSVGGVGS